MKKKVITLIGALGLLAIGCNKHEVIPPPVPMVELETHFVGRIDGTDLEITEFVNGFEGSSDADFEINASSIDRAAYYSSLTSSQTTQSVSIGHGSVFFDAGTASRPPLAQFNAFYNTNLEPQVSGNAFDGFVFKYTDAGNREWTSDAMHILPTEDVIYSNVKQESDSTGDYNKFIVTFQTYIYRTYEDLPLNPGVFLKDSMAVTNAVYKGWYKR